MDFDTSNYIMNIIPFPNQSSNNDDVRVTWITDSNIIVVSDNKEFDDNNNKIGDDYFYDETYSRWRKIEMGR